MKYLFAFTFLLSNTVSLFAQKVDGIIMYSWEKAKFADADTIFGISFEKLKLDTLPD